MIEYLAERDINKMYKRCKYEDKISFNNFYEWVTADINRDMYSLDQDFIVKEKEWLD